MRVAVVVVSYNTRELLRRCLTAVRATLADSADRLQGEVLVVDNASCDGSSQMVAAEFPHVRLIASPVNLGFTGGNNLALKELRLESRDAPQAVLLLNPDAELTPGALAGLCSLLAARPEVGACGPRLVYGDGRFQHGAFRFPSLTQVGLDFFPLSGLPGAGRLHDSRLNGRYPRRLWDGTEPFAVDFVLGACMLVRSEAIRQVGPLDDAFFMYCEEIDWCLRMADAGWQVMALPSAQVVHHEAQSSRQIRWPAYVRLWQSRFYFYVKHSERYSRSDRVLLRALVALGLRGRRRAAWRRFAAGGATGTELGAELAAYAEIEQGLEGLRTRPRVR